MDRGTGVHDRSMVNMSENSSGHTFNLMETRMTHMKNTFKDSLTKAITEALKNVQAQNNNKNNQGSRKTRTKSRVSHIDLCSSDSTDSFDTDTSDIESRSSLSHAHSTKHTRGRNSPKLPPFTGKEKWTVWYNRFDDVASRQHWSEDDRLDELLPRLQGVAGDFVYDQLSRDVRLNYKLLCKELSCRFRVIETSKSFLRKFTNRNQREGESVKDYAFELKMLHDKAHTYRDKVTKKRPFEAILRWLAR